MLLYENKISCLKNIELDYEKEKDKIFCNNFIYKI